jgi:hypothetical protein
MRHIPLLIPLAALILRELLNSAPSIYPPDGSFTILTGILEKFI